MMAFFSIIIPVYNVENYLRQCVDSLYIDSLLHEYEVILVDDGSTDSSGALCDEYAAKNVWVSVIHQQNAGLSSARNKGLLCATGEYVLFLDADDYLEEHALSLLEIKTTDCADLYFLQMRKVFPDGSSILLEKMDDSCIKNQEHILCMRYFAGLAKFPGSACAKLVKRDLLLRHKLFFEEGVTAEDLVWTLKCMLYARTFRYLDFPFYNYRQSRDGSITSKVTARSLADLHYAICSAVAMAQQEEFCMYCQEIYIMMAYEVQVLLMLYGKAGPDARGSCKEMVKEVCWLLEYRKGIRDAGIKWLVRWMGVRYGSRVLYGVWRIGRIQTNI